MAKKVILFALREEFERRFADFKSVKDEFCAFSAPLLTEVPIRLRVEVADLNTDLVYSPLFAPGLDTLSANQSLPPTRYPRLRAFASRYISMFGSKYRCEQVFSRMGYVKNKFRTRLTDLHRADILHISTSDLQPDFNAILKEMQHQSSH